MQATVTDGFSGPLKSLRNQLQQIATSPVGKAVQGDWQGVGRDIGKVTQELRSGLGPALSGIGISSLSVGGAVAGIGVALKSFATGTRDLNLFGKSIGMSVDQLRELRAVGEHFGMSWDGAQQSLKTSRATSIRSTAGGARPTVGCAP